MAAAKKPTKKVDKSRQKKVSVRARKVEAGVIAGKTENEIAAELNISRGGVAKIKAQPEFKERIAARCEDAASLTANEVIGTLANQMRSDITELLPDDGGVIGQIREKGLGHLVKKIKVKREVEPGTFKQFELVEIELHSQQGAAVHLSKILGIEQMPKANEADVAKWKLTVDRLAKKYKKTADEVKRDLLARKPELASVLIS